MTTTHTFQNHREAAMPGPEEIAKQVERRRKAARDLQVAQIKTQDAQDRYAQTFRAPTPKPKAFKPAAPPRPPESVVKGLEDKAYPRVPKFRFETFGSFLARTADQPS